MSKKETAIGSVLATILAVVVAIMLVATGGASVVAVVIGSILSVPLFITFLILKLISVIPWPWFWVVSPIVFTTAAWILLGITYLCAHIWSES